MISPEIGIEKYMMERKIELQKSTVDTRELDTLQPNGKLAPGAEHSEYLPDELNRVTIVTTAVDEAANGDCHGDYPVATKGKVQPRLTVSCLSGTSIIRTY